jgi:hypothetical protein
VQVENPTDNPIVVSLILAQDSKLPERKKFNQQCNVKAKAQEITLVDDEEFENIDPKDNKFCGSKTCCKYEDL